MDMEKAMWVRSIALKACLVAYGPQAWVWYAQGYACGEGSTSPSMGVEYGTSQYYARQAGYWARSVTFWASQKVNSLGVYTQADFDRNAAMSTRNLVEVLGLEVEL